MNHRTRPNHPEVHQFRQQEATEAKTGTSIFHVVQAHHRHVVAQPHHFLRFVTKMTKAQVVTVEAAAAVVVVVAKVFLLTARAATERPESQQPKQKQPEAATKNQKVTTT